MPPTGYAGQGQQQPGGEMQGQGESQRHRALQRAPEGMPARRPDIVRAKKS
ncbi:MAG: hypothetical protein KGN77_13500 [Xanthomonadaceae bacterium]|nr:hypothetical protein [Xanthomonadaceae bacterium]